MSHTAGAPPLAVHSEALILTWTLRPEYGAQGVGQVAPFTNVQNFVDVSADNVLCTRETRAEDTVVDREKLAVAPEGNLAGLATADAMAAPDTSEIMIDDKPVDLASTIELFEHYSSIHWDIAVIVDVDSISSDGPIV